jgi:dihydrofolate reductase
MTTIVFSRIMKSQDHPQVRIVSELTADWIDSLKAQPGNDIWLMGGSEVFRSFLDSGYVDTIESM